MATPSSQYNDSLAHTLTWEFFSRLFSWKSGNPRSTRNLFLIRTIRLPLFFNLALTISIFHATIPSYSPASTKTSSDSLLCRPKTLRRNPSNFLKERQ
jgi:hypothetical protein